MIERVPLDMALTLHEAQWSSGKQRGHKYIAPPQFKEDFVLFDVPVSALSIDALRESLVEGYMQTLERGVNMGPSWGSFSGRNKLIFVFDGNHRAEAAKRLGFEKIKIMMPQSNYDRWVNR